VGVCRLLRFSFAGSKREKSRKSRSPITASFHSRNEQTINSFS